MLPAPRPPARTARVCPPDAAPRAAPHRLINERGDDQAPRRLLALAVGLDVVPSLEVLVDDLPLERGHGLEGDRAPVVDGSLRRLVGRGAERHGSALAIAGSIHHDALAVG